MANTERQGLISRFFARASDTDRDLRTTEGPPSSRHEAWGDNATRPVSDLIKTVLRQPSCLIVTGYQDFLSSLTILLETIENLEERSEGSIRIAFGSNTEARQVWVASAGQWPMKRASIFLGQEAFRLLIWPICAQFLQWTQSSAELSDSAFSIPIWQKKN